MSKVRLVSCVCNMQHFFTRWQIGLSDCWLSIEDHGSYSIGDNSLHFHPSEIFSNVCQIGMETTDWMLPEFATNDGFILDRHCNNPFDTLLVKNRKNKEEDQRYCT